MSLLHKEIERRRTFGIISHPDAGKTTLTEKLLLFGGAIQEAGAVKSNKVKKAALSDFMEIERQRGISVSTSVLSFEYKDIKINILDTPGHKDFAEDTFRTLTAVDSVIVVIDAAKGVEEQTQKLVEVCRMRKIPLIVFINKLDKEAKEGFDLLDEIEEKLSLNTTPLSWPVGTGIDFKGIYNIWENKFLFFQGKEKQKIEESIEFNDLKDQKLKIILGEKALSRLEEELNIIKELYPLFNQKSYLESSLHPVFFGSALTNFGILDLLNIFIKIAPSSSSKEAIERSVNCNEEAFSGFIFKIHANMDPRHRDRIAFLKIVSGIFKRNKAYFHVRLGKKNKYANPVSFFADKKRLVEESYPGDVIGLYDSGQFKIGDSLTEGEAIHFNGIISFSPEHFRYIHNSDPIKAKQLQKGIEQLMDEGLAQLFILELTGKKIIGTVGALQYDVIQYRLEHEYGAKCHYEEFPAYKAIWIEAKEEKSEEFLEFKKLKNRFLAKDKKGQLVYLVDSAFSLDMAKEKFPSLVFRLTSEKI